MMLEHTCLSIVSIEIYPVYLMTNNGRFHFHGETFRASDINFGDRDGLRPGRAGSEGISIAAISYLVDEVVSYAPSAELIGLVTGVW